MCTYQVVRNETLEELKELEQDGYKVEVPAGMPSTISGIISWAKEQPDNTNVRFNVHNIYPRVRQIDVSVQQVHQDADILAPGPVLDKFNQAA